MTLPDDSLPHLHSELFSRTDAALLRGAGSWTHAPRFLLLYGSLRERSFSRLLTFEAARLLQALGGEVRIFDPAGLPLPDSVPDSVRLWFEPMLNVVVPPNARPLEIVSDSVPVVAAVEVMVAPFTSERAGVVAERDRMNADVEPVVLVLANRIESTLTAPPRSLVDVVLVGLPR
jgi:hypothetical protein